MSNINTDILDGLIIGRVDPQIYAFSTHTIPNYLKIGDTYRPIEIRLDEWRKYFPNLVKKFSDVAKVDEEIFFRDHAIHSFLESSGKTRLQKGDIDEFLYFSNEFFKDTEVKDVKEAIDDIKKSHLCNDGRYQFYRFEDSRIPVSFTWKREENYKPRPNQQNAIDKFNEAIQKKHTNLLMYAVMRFGKSFTSMCCATEMDAQLVVIVSAKADVKAEWKKTVESHIRFEGYKFLDSNSLQNNRTIITDTLKENRVALFLTLQDLQGDEIKTKHKDLFNNNIDLLLIDETHFGVRGEEYGKVLNDIGITNNDERKKELEQIDDDLVKLDETIKILKSRIRIHLSGTPYRILMGSEFTKDNIISFCQFTDIVDEQEKWNDENLNKDDVKEWDNPYYGFPQMVRFAFNPNESSIKKMEELKKNGITYAFSALFKPQSISKDSKLHKHQKFEHEQEILDLLKVIDGSKNDDNLLGFLDYDKIKNGKMCRHIVCVLPYRASCDAMQNLINNNNGRFKNLSNYEIINIAGVEDDRTYKKIEIVKAKIKQCEEENKKTLTLTVNRMLTGSTVEEWDTMLYFKDTASPQEYDQSIFRLQNQYVRSYKNSKGDEIKFNMKPQTLLVDFDPYRLFRMQERKSQIYNANVENNGNDKLGERIKRELEVSPLIVLNHNRIRQVTPTDILKAVSEYSNDKSVKDEATVIPIDFSLLTDDIIKTEIDKQHEIDSRKGLKTKAVEGDGDDLDTPEGKSKDKDKGDNDKPKESKEIETDIIRKKFATYYSRLLFFAFLTKSAVHSVKDIINSININDDDKRIAKNLEIKGTILKLFEQKMNPFILSKLDYKIQNLNDLANDTSLEPLEKAENALRKFGRLSDSEIVTPAKVADNTVAILPKNGVINNAKILDIASKQGEFAIALYKRFKDKVKNNIYSVTTSLVAYELTHKVYEILDIPTKNIFAHFTSYDIIGDKSEKITNELKNMNFNVVIGNPPYQEDDGGAGASAKAIYPDFICAANKISSQYISIIIPSRWYAGGKGLEKFRNIMLNDIHIKEFHDFLHPEEVFPNTNNRGGVCSFLTDKFYDNRNSKIMVITHEKNNQIRKAKRLLKTDGVDIFIRHTVGVSIYKKIKNDLIKRGNCSEIISSRKPFGIDSTYKSILHKKNENLHIPIICYCKRKSIYYIEKDKIPNQNYIGKYKIFTPRANNIGTELNDDNLNTFIGKPETVCSESYIIIGVNMNLNKITATNVAKYFRTKFVRFLHSIAKCSQDATSKTYKFIPILDFTKKSDINWNETVMEINQQLYAKYSLTPDEIAFIETTIKPM